MKILNLYACLGGNRYKWGDSHDITAVELDSELARMYKERFPNDTVIVADAHEYLLNHYKEFDFIWSSPPCPTHSKIRHQKAYYRQDNIYKVVYADMSLYQEVILLDKYFKGVWLVENVDPYYKPLIPAQKRGRHLYWSNFRLPTILSTRKAARITSGGNEIKNLCEFHEIDLSGYNGKQRKNKIARNLVDYEAGKTILDTAIKIHDSKQVKQGVLNFEL